MSWYGTHAKVSRDEIKRLLPPAACKQCIYWFRVVIGSSPEIWYREHDKCPRCGIPKWEILRSLGDHPPITERRLSRPETPCPPRRAEENVRKLTGVAKWIAFFTSRSPTVRLRAAHCANPPRDTPLTILLEILDKHSLDGLGAATEKALLKRDEPEMFNAMISRLVAGESFIREVACNVLGAWAIAMPRHISSRD